MGIANYFDSDPNFTRTQEAELVRLTKALRQVIDSSVKLNAPLETLTQLANHCRRRCKWCCAKTSPSAQ